MIVNFENARDQVARPHDICIVGAGPAGISLAMGLARAGRSVLLLEGGGLHHEAFAHRLYEGTRDGLRFDGLTEGRFRGLGGTSTQWGGQVLEIDDHVFPPRPWVPESGWPLAKSALEPYYRRALAVEDLEGALSDAAAIWRERELPRLELGDAFISAFSKWCPERDLAKLHMPALRTLDGLTVALHANVCAVNLDGERRRVISVTCRYPGQPDLEIAAGTFVLCMGGVETSRLLLQPLADGSAPPWMDGGHVGRHFQDHLVADVAVLTPTGLTNARTYFDYVSVKGHRYHPKIKLAPSAQRALRTLDAAAAVSFMTNGVDNVSAAFETIKRLKSRQFDRLKIRDYGHLGVNLHRLLWHKIPALQKVMKASSAKGELNLTVHCEQDPRSESHIRLADARDSLGMRRVHLSWRLSDLEFHTFRTYATHAKAAFESRGLAQLRTDPRLDAGIDAFAPAIRESYHHLGGARMAASSRDGVVDPNLKMFTMDNMYVCGGAVFPCAGFANPTHTIIALAERLCDHLSGRTFSPDSAMPDIAGYSPATGNGRTDASHNTTA